MAFVGRPSMVPDFTAIMNGLGRREPDEVPAVYLPVPPKPQPAPAPFTKYDRVPFQAENFEEVIIAGRKIIDAFKPSPAREALIVEYAVANSKLLKSIEALQAADRKLDEAEYERLQTKCGDAEKAYKSAQVKWNEALQNENTANEKTNSATRKLNEVKRRPMSISRFPTKAEVAAYEASLIEPGKVVDDCKAAEALAKQHTAQCAKEMYRAEAVMDRLEQAFMEIKGKLSNTEYQTASGLIAGPK